MANELTLLSDDLQNKIITGVLEGKTYRALMAELGLKESTFYNWLWNDYKGLRQRVNEAKREVILRETEDISNQIRRLDTLDDKGRHNAKLLAIKQKEAEFLRETLGKDEYSKRQETTGADGTPLSVNVMQYTKPRVIDAVIHDTSHEMQAKDIEVEPLNTQGLTEDSHEV
jgi:hypothetical protein